MALDNHWIDGLARDRGTYRAKPVGDIGNLPNTDRALKSLCNPEEYEDALIEALDMGLTADEIADITLGAIS